MKVCTDACLFGAWVIEYVKSNPFQKIPEILDIGTGTGLLSLMIAQEINCSIDAVELDPPAALQASKNIDAAGFQAPIQVIEFNVKEWKPKKQYDIIICNPPFFENHLASTDSQKNRALHSSDLDLKTLLHLIDHHLKENGIAAILLPFYRKQETLIAAAKKKLYPIALADVHQSNHHNAFRTLFILSRQHLLYSTEIIIIKDHQEYSERFKTLLKKFYLAF